MTEIDPITGLPSNLSDSVIQQIPLGQQVFPFADLDAPARPLRVPLYNEDVVSTTALITGQDKTGQPRAATMDTAQRLYTREAVFQSNGAPIEDGDTAPVDVNIVGSGGGGGAPTYELVQTFAFEVFGNRSGDSFATTFFTQHNCVLLAMDIEWYWNNTTGITYSAYYHTLRLATNIGTGDIQLAGVRMIGGGSATYPPSPPTQKMFVFPGGLRLDPAVVPGNDDQFMLYSHGTVGDKLGINGTLWLGTYT